MMEIVQLPNHIPIAESGKRRSYELLDRWSAKRTVCCSVYFPRALLFLPGGKRKSRGLGIYCLLPRFKLWSNLFNNCIDDDWHDPKNLSALWDLTG